MPDRTISIDLLDALVFDFDGVLTNNKVHIGQDGKEWVSCDRGDGLGFDVLRKLNLPTYILSTEKNPIISARAKKLRITAIQGVTDKVKALKMLVRKKGFSLENILYVGNDLNDLRVMQLCGYSACPGDSHPQIKNIAAITLQTRGGEGVVRELLEQVFKLDLVELLYLK